MSEINRLDRTSGYLPPVNGDAAADGVPTTSATGSTAAVRAPLAFEGPVPASGLGQLAPSAGKPPLPPVQSNASPQDTLSAVDMLMLSDCISESSLMWTQLSVLLQGARLDKSQQDELRKSAEQAKIMAADGKVAAKKSKLEADIKEAQNEVGRATVKLAISVAVAAVTIGAACSSPTNPGEGASAADKAKYDADLKSHENVMRAADACGKAFNTYSEVHAAQSRYESIKNGAKHESLMKDIEEALWAKAEEVASAVADDAKAGAESAKELHKMALKVIREVEERRSQNVSTFTRI